MYVVKTFFPHCLVGGRELDRQCSNKMTLIVSNGKGFNYMSEHTGLNT